jgi:hypothetical protein
MLVRSGLSELKILYSLSAIQLMRGRCHSNDITMARCPVHSPAEPRYSNSRLSYNYHRSPSIIAGARTRRKETRLAQYVAQSASGVLSGKTKVRRERGSTVESNQTRSLQCSPSVPLPRARAVFPSTGAASSSLSSRIRTRQRGWQAWRS